MSQYLSIENVTPENRNVTPENQPLHASIGGSLPTGGGIGGLPNPNKRTLLFCMVLKNPWGPAAMKKHSRPSDPEKMYSEYYGRDAKRDKEKDLESEGEDSEDAEVIPREYLGREFKNKRNVLLGDQPLEVESDASDEPARSSSQAPGGPPPASVDDFVTFCKQRMFDEKSMFVELLRRLTHHQDGDGIAIYPPGMLVNDGAACDPSALWTSPDENEVYIVLQFSHRALEVFAEKKQIQLQTNAFSSLGGAGAIFTRALDRELADSVLAYRDVFDKRRGALQASSGSVFKGWGFRLHIPQRSRLVERLLKDRYHGLGIEFDRMINKDFVMTAFFPLHNSAYQETYGLTAWASLRPLFSTHPMTQPLSGVVAYFGEKVGMYFHWIHTYTRYLMPLALVGIALQIYVWVRGHDLMHGVFAMMVTVWGVMWSTHWHREERRYAHKFGTHIEMEQEIVRDEFVGPRAELSDYHLLHGKFAYPLTMEVSHGGALVHRKDNLWLRRVRRYLIAYPIVIITITALLVCLYYLTRWRFEILGNKNMEYVSNGVTVVIMVSFAFAFQNIVGFLTTFENNRTESEHENSLINKIFVFSFCNAYSALFIIALWPMGLQTTLLEQRVMKYCNHTQILDTMGQFVPYNTTLSDGILNNTANACGCMWFALAGLAREGKTLSDLPEKPSFCPKQVDRLNNDNRLDQLFDQLLVILIMKPFLQNLQELLIPIIFAWIRKCSCSFSRKRKTSFDHFGEGLRATLWQEAKKEPYLSTCEDYHEIALQCGYMLMFAVVFPLGPAVCVLFNILEIRIDAIKLISIEQRPRCRTATSIGAWNTVFRFLTFCSVITNAYVICFIANYVEAWVPVDGSGDAPKEGRWISFVAVQYLIGMTAGLVVLLRDLVPEDVAKELIKQSVLGDRKINRKDA